MPSKKSFLILAFLNKILPLSYSKKPVILFDRWKRYKHCNSEEDVMKKNSAIYYVDNENKLIDCIDTIRNSTDIKFNNYIFEGSSKKNINNLINKLL